MALKMKDYLREQVINRVNRDRLSNNDFSIISSNCTGAFILHELRQRFNSPTVNLYMDAKDYIRFLENLDIYLQCDLKEISNNQYNYPLGALDDLVIHFMHYSSFEQAKEKWQERIQRIHTENLFVMMCERDGCSKELMERFDQLPYKNKVIFTHLPYPEIKSAFYISGFEKEKELGHLYKYQSIFNLKKHYDKFDYVKWLNDGAES